MEELHDSVQLASRRTNEMACKALTFFSNTFHIWYHVDNKIK